MSCRGPIDIPSGSWFISHESFLKLRYPHYWHYDFLIGLKVMAEAGRIGDPRCGDALDLLASKRLADGGWRAEGKHYRVVDEPANGGSLADWGPVSRRQVMNPFVTLDALQVLRAAGRLRFAPPPSNASAQAYAGIS